MKAGPFTALLIAAVFGSALDAYGLAPREDAIWARRSLDPITLDGVLDEPAWAQAESVIVEFGQDAGIPGSGWKIENGTPTDLTYATLRLLTHENQLYLAAVVRDSSVGGSSSFNLHDGFLMAIKDHADPNAPKPPAEYFYAWWYPTEPDPQPPGQPPAFIGRWAEWPPGTPRTPEQIAAWDAATVVHGLSNSDATLDEGYTVEMRFDLTPMGYDVTRPQGDIVEWNISVYDCDWLWPLEGQRLAYNRVWWQGPWGNAMWYNEVRIHARPQVTSASGPAPTIGAEIWFPELDATGLTVDGSLDEPVWDDPRAYTFDILYGDDVLRQTYPAVGPYRAGQYQPIVNGGQAFVIDPGDATVKIFFDADFLYLGFDVRDQVVQYVPDFDRWDGFLVLLNEREERGPDQQLLGRRLSFQVNQDGSALPQDYLATLVSEGGAEVAIELKPGTTVDTTGMTPDTGYWAELKIDLTRLGYPPGLGDGTLFIGVDLLDGDSFTPFTDSYGTRTWWFREYESECCPAWVYLAPENIGIDPDPSSPAERYALVGSYPNPSPRPTIRFELPEATRVKLEVFDVKGRMVEERILGVLGAGLREVVVEGDLRTSGVYPYRLTLEDPETGAQRASLAGKLVLLR